MEKYNYRESVKEDIRQYIKDNGILVTPNNRYSLEDKLRDELWACDSVTGNASGSYTFNTWQAEENLCHNYDLLVDACTEFGSDIYDCLDSPERADVTIRCYLLSECIDSVLDELEVELDEDYDIDDSTDVSEL